MNRTITHVAVIALGVLMMSVKITSMALAQGNYERPPIHYLNAEVNDPVAVLNRKLESGEAKLVRDKGGCLSCLASNRTPGVPGYRTALLKKHDGVIVR